MVNDLISYFTKAGRVPEIRGAERAYARSAPLISGFSQLFRDLLNIIKF